MTQPAPRHILLVAIGSAGDVHPFVGLGRELKSRGHDVTVITNPHFQSLIESAGLGFVPVGTEEEYLKITEDPDLWHPTKAFYKVAEFGFIRPLRPVYEAIRERYVPGRTVVAAAALAMGARVAEEKLGVPMATIQIAPAVLRSVYDTPRLPGAYMPAAMPKFIKRGIYWMVDKVVDRIIAPRLNAFRAELGLATPARRVLADWWMSPRRVIGIFPDFFAPPQSDWPLQLRLTSFPLYDGRGVETVPAELEAFIAAGPPPVIFTPGSANRHARQFFETAAHTCAALQRRGVLLSKFSENVPPQLPPGVRHFPYAPLSQILPRLAALVSHGGVGTIAQGLAAGVPQVVMVLAHDQLDNAARLERLGVGQWTMARRFTPRFLAAALGQLLDSSVVAARCADCRSQLAAHNGIRETADLIEAL